MRSLFAAVPRAWRSLTRRPGYFAIAVSSLAIALGLATTVIAHLDSLLHPDLGTPYDNRLYLANVGGLGQTAPTEDEVVGLFRALPIVERVATAKLTFRSSVEVGATGSEQGVWRVSPAFFETLGVTPVRGRWFRANETAASAVALVTEDAWFNRLGATESLDSARVVVNGVSYTVVGVVPRNLPPFVPMSFGPGARPDDIILPATTESATEATQWRSFFLLRSRRKTARNAMQTAIAPIATQLMAKHGVGAFRGREQPFVAYVAPLSAYRPIRVDGYEKGMLVAVAIIVLIACANVSALMLARAVAKRRDQALRLALGASRRHIVGDIAAEVSVIAVAGALAGIVIGYWSMRILAAVTPPDLPWLGFRAPHWSPWVFAGLFGVVMLTVVVASIVPAFFVSRIAPIEQLKDNSGTTTGRPKRAFQLLVVAELAMSLCLMFGAVLVAKSANTVARFDFGYDARGIVSIYAGVEVVRNPRPLVLPDPAGKTPLERRGVREIALGVPDEIVERIKRLPGVRDASWVMGAFDARNVMLSDESSTADRQLVGADKLRVGAGFVRALGLQIVAGRDFVAGDDDGNGAVILDEVAARRLFSNGQAVGKMVKLGQKTGADPWIPVVGVVRTARHSMPEDPAVAPNATVYVSQTTERGFQPSFVVRPEAGARDIRPAVAAVVSDLMPPLTRFGTSKWVETFDTMLTTRRFTAGMFLTLSFASLALAAAGLFGVLSYAVNQRMREFAVRVALGAQRAHVVRLVVRDGLLMALGGTAIGGTVAMYAAFTLWQWLWGVYPVDATALIIAEGALLAVTLAGAILPAIRATRANPVDVMRAS